VAAAAAAVTMAEEAWRVRTPPLTLDFANYSIYSIVFSCDLTLFAHLA
jgi:hypothetical protein